jgi:hypothetical protein
MKKILFLIFASALLGKISTVNAQSYSFAFSQFTSNYVPLTGGTGLYGTTPWTNNGTLNLQFGFNFNFMGYNQTTFDFFPGTAYFPSYIDNMGMISFYAELEDTGRIISKSPITYLLSGTVGNRILKIQVADAGFHEEFIANGSYSSAVNFQTWFYEADNSIEVHMGPSTIVNPAACYSLNAQTGPTIGPVEIDATGSSVLYSLMLSGNPLAPTFANFNLSGNPFPSLNSTPASGTVYRFAQVVSGVEENENIFSSATLFPNPTTNNSRIGYSIKKEGPVSIVITDMEGRVIASGNEGIKAEGNYQYDLNTENFSNGIYFVTLVSGEQKITQKLSVAH